MFEDCPVKILQVESEFEWLFDIYKSLKPKRVLEIGSFYGGSLYYWVKGAAQGATLLSVDRLIHPNDDRYPLLKSSRGMWPDWVKRTDKKLISITGNSQDVEVVGRVKELLTEIDFLYIDADHTYEGCDRDVKNYWPLVRSGGVMILHDISNHEHGAWKVWDGIKTLGIKTEEKMDQSEYCGMGVAWKQ